MQQSFIIHNTQNEMVKYSCHQQHMAVNMIKEKKITGAYRPTDTTRVTATLNILGDRIPLI